MQWNMGMVRRGAIALVAAGLVLAAALLLPAPPAPTIKGFTSDYAIQLLPTPKVVKLVPAPAPAPDVNRSAKADYRVFKKPDATATGFYGPHCSPASSCPFRSL